MCALPARSIPGSEMPLVENTRMRGSRGVAPSAGHHLTRFDEQSPVAGLLDVAQVFVPDLLRPHRNVLVGPLIGRQDFQDSARRDRGHRALGFEQRAGTRGAPGVDGLGRLERLEIDCHVTHRCCNAPRISRG